jgi:hypothetical protein
LDDAVADSAGKPWCRRLHRAAVYTVSSHRTTIHVPVRPRRAFPRTASHALVTSSPWSTRAAQAEADPARPWAACIVQMGRAGTVDVGHALLCNWAVRGFGPVTVELIFLFSEYIQFLTNSKICVGFI